MAKPALGRGLGALIQPRVASPEPAKEKGERIQNVPHAKLFPSPLQPRKEFRKEQLQELVDSIREKGVIQPLIVRQSGEKYELIAGERRWRAAGLAGLKEMPVIIREATDREVLELALIENLQREDLNPIEEAHAYTRLAKDFSLTQEEIAERVGRSRASIANAIRLLDLDSEVQNWLVQGRLSVGHGKVLLGIHNPEEQRLIATSLIRQAASVRTAEKLIAAHLAKSGRTRTGNRSSSVSELSPALKRIENALRNRLSTRVTLQHKGKTGSVTIEYYGNDDLERLLKELGISLDS